MSRKQSLYYLFFGWILFFFLNSLFITLLVHVGKREWWDANVLLISIIINAFPAILIMTGTIQILRGMLSSRTLMISLAMLLILIQALGGYILLIWLTIYVYLLVGGQI